MPKVRLDSKFCYWNGYKTIFLNGNASLDTNGNFFNLNMFDSQVTSPIIMPETVLPDIGNNHNQRHGNRITVSSVRWKSIISLNPDFVNLENPFSKYQPSPPATPVQADWRIPRFFKMRYMLVQWDNDYVDQISDEFIYRWFKMTYCWYRPQANEFTEYYDNPVSVHSNILHETTELTSKFNILCDKCITLTNSKPQISLDITIPLNKNYLFDEDDPDTLIYPCLSLFILPPLSFIVDTDPVTKAQYEDFIDNHPGQHMDVPLYSVENFTKLNFIDL